MASITDGVGAGADPLRDGIGAVPSANAFRHSKNVGCSVTEPTMVMTKDGCKRNGNLLFTIRPIQAVLQQDYDRQMQKLDEDAVRRKFETK